jgi:mannose-6-phosphate isomerase-like protein (cupin superfamily)
MSQTRLATVYFTALRPLIPLSLWTACHDGRSVVERASSFSIGQDGRPPVRTLRFPRHRVSRIPSHPFDVYGVAERLASSRGGYEVVHDSPGLEVGVYVLVAPEPDRQQPHEHDEIYVVLTGRGTLAIEGEDFPLEEGHAIFVPARAEHRFTGYEGLSVLVIFDKSGR